MTIQHQPQDVIKATDNYGVEYYTERKTGASGMSQSGLARMCNVYRNSIQNLLKLIDNTKAPKSLEHWHNAKLTIDNTAPQYDGRNPNIYKAEFCFDVIAHYADKGNETARNNERILGRAGATLFCQRMTGWNPSPFGQYPLPQTYSEAMRLAADEMEARERAEAKNERLEAQATENAPKVQAYELLINSEGNVEMKDFADTLNIKGLGRNNFIDLLRARGVFTPDNRGVGCTPYRRYIDAGYFEVKEKSTRVGIFFYTVITPKGQDWMLKQLRKWEILPAAS
jgi:phage antirepressor YoqD-like protein